MAFSNIKQVMCTKCNVLIFKISNIRCHIEMDVECSSCGHGMNIRFGTEKSKESNFVKDYED